MRKLNPVLATEREYIVERGKDQRISEYYGEDTFNISVAKAKLPKEVFKKFTNIINDRRVLDIDTANSVAHAMKEWALEKGATHFAHWFQPMTGLTAEKHDAFIEHAPDGKVIERFSGKQLVQGEPDASSFPSGGIRATFEARGYTAWDMSSPAFIRRNGIATTLTIPTAFISYTGEALDKKTPLLRSIAAVNKSGLKALKSINKNDSKRLTSNGGPEQEYFLIDQDYFYKRQDLVLSGRTLMGAAPAKGQQLDDQYFGAIKERVQSFMHDLEEELFKLGIPAKTRHNEVAPSQFELAPIYEEGNVAADHNQIIMETIKMTAKSHGLAALLNEKPFAGLNGSGKHLNWSISDDQGFNFFNPGNNPATNIPFLLFLAGVIKGVHKNGDIIRATVASAGNDHRLGANEAPPAILSIFLGDQLSQILDDIEQGKITKTEDAEKINLGSHNLAVLDKDATDRNRTSPFAFTGNKFEFRALGSAQSISTPATVLNLVLAEALDEIADMIDAKNLDTDEAVYSVIRDILKESKSVLFSGDNYSEDWEVEAAKRGLPNNKTTPEALRALDSDKARAIFKKYDVLSHVELKSRYFIKLERYVSDIEIEAKTVCNMARTSIIPACLKYQEGLAASISSTESILGDSMDLSAQICGLKFVAENINSLYSRLKELGELIEKSSNIHEEQERADYFCFKVKAKMNETREIIDTLETVVDDELWPIPKFWEMLFIN